RDPTRLRVSENSFQLLDNRITYSAFSEFRDPTRLRVSENSFQLLDNYHLFQLFRLETRDCDIENSFQLLDNRITYSSLFPNLERPDTTASIRE
ncbi:hypothetical protein J6590_053862, partial [Homalodisca vitripennis]